MSKKHSLPLLAGSALAATLFVGAIVIQANQKSSITNVPLPQGAPAGTEYMMPNNLAEASGGPYKSTAEVKTLALQAAASKNAVDPKVSAIVQTTHGALITAGVFGNSYSVANDREVYLATVEGAFTITRVPQGHEDIQASHLNVEIDATNGDILASGTSTVTLDMNLVKSLATNADRFWINP